MPPKPNPALYSIPKTFIWFAIVSFVLLFGLIGIVRTDYVREWKEWQKQFIRLKLEKAKQELKTAEAAIDKTRLAELEQKAADEEKRARGDERRRRDLVKQNARSEARVAKARGRYQDLKQFRDSYKYFFEKSGKYEGKLKKLGPRLTAARQALEAAESEKETLEARLRELDAARDAARRSLGSLVEERDRIRKRARQLAPSAAKAVLDAPMLDFLAPSLRIQQIVLDDLYDDYHFVRTQKVDRCVTCHLGIDQKGFEDAPQPFRTHPDLELYLGASSAHPIDKFGCTVCHSGNGHSVSFTDTAHTPRSEGQAAEWKKKHHWRDLEKWDAKMLPVGHVQASCAKCHTSQAEIPKADKLNRGREIIRDNGCLGCHKVAGMEPAWKAGPDLENIKSKLGPDWVRKWLRDPASFRERTRMPRVYHLSNTSGPEDRERNTASIDAISAYLHGHSGEVPLEMPPVEGDPSHGQVLTQTIGCTGCHAVGGTAINAHGPDLTGLGSKVSREWLYTWLKDPAHYSKTTRMPSLRLTDQEAADITAYLLADRNEAFDGQAIPGARPEVIDELILITLSETERLQDAEAKLAGMSGDQRLDFLGKKSIAHQGCFGCHHIPGFEDAKPIGTELSDEARKDIHQLDFGFVPIEHSRLAWFRQKLKDSRGFDHGKVKAYYEKLRMPDFRFTDQEIDAVITFLLSLSEEYIPPQMKPAPDARSLAVQRGQVLSKRLNCAGCHDIDGRKGSLREAAEDKGIAPPTLEGEGAKVQEKWLHDFLRSPYAVRSWLTYRMPTFRMGDQEARTFVEYFTALAGQEVSYAGHPAPATTPGALEAGKQLFTQLQCAKCHEVSPASQAMGASFLAPDLKLAHRRLKPSWVEYFVTDPQALQPGTMMPQFFPDGASPLPDVLGGDAARQIEAIRDYLYSPGHYELESKDKNEQEISP
ncbi:MAG: hypothetical protein A3D28_04595 [Omnitrophica bacterium RIFCSPHIGHO2_02_FULL_63_14]|nr:MAG: hypothetical protein A3D28_04595 [Omnitrophica bacterium RIFCSPHIGHO2_02_FULL_63_14]